MKKSILELGKPLNKTAQRNITGGITKHLQCKANALSIEFTSAEILKRKPIVSKFMDEYKKCMGYN
ncbi:hypothetical protein [Tenacibaculum soleae]|uniref:hypothetical protein n=1 Tax=Tenacibaculum soleae TaxID=447689 RepID=UPI0026E3173E|nr:hypothetical protein [Tenacibaculum soleae]MDO6811511.1 hypothetical protein [Tenacibaculum soleae]